jgi:hypothetical protein
MQDDKADGAYDVRLTTGIQYGVSREVSWHMARAPPLLQALSDAR